MVDGASSAAACGAAMSAHQQPVPRQIPSTTEQKWTADEVMALRVAWRDPNVATADIPGLLRERSLKAARHMANVLGLGARPKPEKPPKQEVNFWTQEEDAILRAHWHIMSRQEIAAKVERTASAVSKRAMNLHLGRSQYARQVMIDRAKISIQAARAKQPQGIAWSAEEVAALRKHWPDVEAVHRATGRSRSGVERKARVEGMPPRTGYRLPSPDVVRGTKEENRLTLRPDPVPTIKRNCLCCSRGFEAPTRFIRLCGPCKGGRD